MFGKARTMNEVFGVEKVQNWSEKFSLACPSRGVGDEAAPPGFHSRWRELFDIVMRPAFT